MTARTETGTARDHGQDIEPCFGCCPVCGSEGVLHDTHPSGDVYLVCDEHRVAWGIGNVTGRLRDEARSGAIAWEDIERIAAENRAKLRGYRIIEPEEATRFPGSPIRGSRSEPGFPF